MHLYEAPPNSKAYDLLKSSNKQNEQSLFNLIDSQNKIQDYEQINQMTEQFSNQK